MSKVSEKEESIEVKGETQLVGQEKEMKVNPALEGV